MNGYLALTSVLILACTLALVVRDVFKYARGERKPLVK
jgi:hypothetical protein